MKEAGLYSIKVWLTTIIVAPIIAGIIQLCLDPLTYNFNDIFLALFYAFPAGIILCIPSLLLFWLITWYLNKYCIGIIRKKIYITLLCSFLTILPFSILNIRALTHSNYWPSLMPWLISCFIVLIGSVWLYDIKSTTMINQQNSITP